MCIDVLSIALTWHSSWDSQARSAKPKAIKRPMWTLWRIHRSSLQHKENCNSSFQTRNSDLKYAKINSDKLRVSSDRRWPKGVGARLYKDNPCLVLSSLTNIISGNEPKKPPLSNLLWHLTDEVDDDRDLKVGGPLHHLHLLHDPGVLLQELAGGVICPLSPRPVQSAVSTRIIL